MTKSKLQLKSYLYFLTGLAVYLSAVFYLHFFFGQAFADFLAVFIIPGVIFSLIAWLLLREEQMVPPRSAIKNEVWILSALIAWIILYITWGATFVNQFIPESWIANEKINSFIVLVRKLLVFVAVPWLVYKSFGFTGEDLGVKNTLVKLFSRKGLFVFIVLSTAAVLFQFFLSNGSKTVRNGEFSFQQLAVGLPLCFLWLFIEAGLVEEFFYRVILQSRLTILLKSPTGGVVITALIFGLSHAPGLYLRGAESEGVDEQLPFLFWAAYTVAYMSVAGIFLGIVWQRTQNLWLVMAIHAMLDLLPNVGNFIKTWGPW